MSSRWRGTHLAHVGSDIPQEAKQFVTPAVDGLLLDSPAGRILPAFWVAVAAFGTCVVSLAGAAGFVAVFANAPTFFVVALFAAITAIVFFIGIALTVALYARAVRPHPIHLTKSGISGLPFHLPVTPKRVIIKGHPGTSIRIDAGVKLVSVSGSQLLAQTGWSYDALSWFAEALATLWSVPLDNSLDEASWRRWLTDVEYRRSARFDEIHAKSLKRHASWYQVPEAAVDATYTHHGLRVDTLTIEDGELRDRKIRVPLEAIERVEVVFLKARHHNGEYVSHKLVGALLLQVNDGQGTLKVARRFTLAPSDAGQLKGLASLVRTHAANAKAQDKGSADEIPEALRAMRASERAR